jgi:hypothetical protein
MPKVSSDTIVGIDQVAATITAALIAKSSKGDELGAVNLFFKIRSMLGEHGQQLLGAAEARRLPALGRMSP